MAIVGFVLYQLYEYNRVLLSPVVELANAGAKMFSAPGSVLSHVPGANRLAAAGELVYRLGKAYGKPAWGIHEVQVGGPGAASAAVQVVEQTVLEKPFCRLLRFERRTDEPDVALHLTRDPVVLV